MGGSRQTVSCIHEVWQELRHKLQACLANQCLLHDPGAHHLQQHHAASNSASDPHRLLAWLQGSTQLWNSASDSDPWDCLQPWQRESDWSLHLHISVRPSTNSTWMSSLQVKPLWSLGIDVQPDQGIPLWKGPASSCGWCQTQRSSGDHWCTTR